MLWLVIKVASIARETLGLQARLFGRLTIGRVLFRQRAQEQKS